MRVCARATETGVDEAHCSYFNRRYQQDRKKNTKRGFKKARVALSFKRNFTAAQLLDGLKGGGKEGEKEGGLPVGVFVSTGLFASC